jgi:hypothetical protein
MVFKPSIPKCDCINRSKRIESKHPFLRVRPLLSYLPTSLGAETQLQDFFVTLLRCCPYSTKKTRRIHTIPIVLVLVLVQLVLVVLVPAMKVDDVTNILDLFWVKNCHNLYTRFSTCSLCLYIG